MKFIQIFLASSVRLVSNPICSFIPMLSSPSLFSTVVFTLSRALKTLTLLHSIHSMPLSYCFFPINHDLQRNDSNLLLILLLFFFLLRCLYNNFVCIQECAYDFFSTSMYVCVDSSIRVHFSILRRIEQ